MYPSDTYSTVKKKFILFTHLEYVKGNHKRKIPLSWVRKGEIFLHWAEVERSSVLFQTLFQFHSFP